MGRPPFKADESAEDGAGDLLETGDDLGFRLSRRWIVAAVVVVALVVAVPRLLEANKERRERAAAAAVAAQTRRAAEECAAAQRAELADRVALWIKAVSIHEPGEHTAGKGNGMVELGMTVKNSGEAVRVEDATLTPLGLPAIDVRHPEEISAHGDGEFLATLRAPCSSVLQLPGGGIALKLVVTTQSGRRRDVALDGIGDAKLMLRHSCDLPPPGEAAAVHVSFVAASPDRLRLAVELSNKSRHPLTLLEIQGKGLSVESSVKLPHTLVGRGAITAALTVRVTSCGELGFPVGEPEEFPLEFAFTLRGIDDEVDTVVVTQESGLTGSPSAEQRARRVAFLRRFCPA